MNEERNKNAGTDAGDRQVAAFRIVGPDPSVLPSAYANFAQIGFSPHDFRLSFGTYAFPVLTEPPDDQVDVPVQPVATIAIPLNLAKALIRALETQVEAWERAFNEPIPDQPQPGNAPEAAQ